MPTYDITITMTITRSYSASVTAKDEIAAEAKIQALIDKTEGDDSKFPWDCDADDYDIEIEVEGI